MTQKDRNKLKKQRHNRKKATYEEKKDTFVQSTFSKEYNCNIFFCKNQRNLKSKIVAFKVREEKHFILTSEDKTTFQIKRKVGKEGLTSEWMTEEWCNFKEAIDILNSKIPKIARNMISESIDIDSEEFKKAQEAKKRQLIAEFMVDSDSVKEFLGKEEN